MPADPGLQDRPDYPIGCPVEGRCGADSPRVCWKDQRCAGRLGCIQSHPVLQPVLSIQNFITEGTNVDVCQREVVRLVIHHQDTVRGRSHGVGGCGIKYPETVCTKSCVLMGLVM